VQTKDKTNFPPHPFDQLRTGSSPLPLRRGEKDAEKNKARQKDLDLEQRVMLKFFDFTKGLTQCG